MNGDMSMNALKRDLKSASAATKKVEPVAPAKGLGNLYRRCRADVAMILHLIGRRKKTTETDASRQETDVYTDEWSIQNEVHP